MSLSHITHIDQSFEEDDTPVTTRYGIQTGNGVLRLAGASFSGPLPHNEMPPEITVERTGGTLDAKDRYIHFSCTDRISASNQSEVFSLRREVANLRESLQVADMINNSKDRTIELYVAEFDRLSREASIGIFARIRAFFGAKA